MVRHPREIQKANATISDKVTVLVHVNSFRHLQSSPNFRCVPQNSLLSSLLNYNFRRILLISLLSSLLSEWNDFIWLSQYRYQTYSVLEFSCDRLATEKSKMEQLSLGCKNSPLQELPVWCSWAVSPSYLKYRKARHWSETTRPQLKGLVPTMPQLRPYSN